MDHQSRNPELRFEQGHAFKIVLVKQETDTAAGRDYIVMPGTVAGFFRACAGFESLPRPGRCSSNNQGVAPGLPAFVHSEILS